MQLRLDEACPLSLLRPILAPVASIGCLCGEGSSGGGSAQAHTLALPTQDEDGGQILSPVTHSLSWVPGAGWRPTSLPRSPGSLSVFHRGPQRAPPQGSAEATSSHGPITVPADATEGSPYGWGHFPMKSPQARGGGILKFSSFPRSPSQPRLPRPQALHPVPGTSHPSLSCSKLLCPQLWAVSEGARLLGMPCGLRGALCGWHLACGRAHIHHHCNLRCHLLGTSQRASGILSPPFDSASSNKPRDRAMRGLWSAPLWSQQAQGALGS